MLQSINKGQENRTFQTAKFRNGTDLVLPQAAFKWSSLSGHHTRCISLNQSSHRCVFGQCFGTITNTHCGISDHCPSAENNGPEAPGHTNESRYCCIYMSGCGDNFVQRPRCVPFHTAVRVRCWAEHFCLWLMWLCFTIVKPDSCTFFTNAPGVEELLSWKVVHNTQWHWSVSIPPSNSFTLPPQALTGVSPALFKKDLACWRSI